ncbi:dihydroneopterin aldolase [Thalassospira lucentensis]|uniref:dihydroneopterin aldolase n=1 Tax=Thalassospira lucentensis TaxID=168935 RepID=UPI00142E7579|nr:dihydroneopterin aldolase [Thalassospira lucentensis]NIZ00342.1 dihydroneopterin aldolase [Thalassospira lucentensis]
MENHLIISERKITLSKYTIPFWIGIHAFEKKERQNVSINIELIISNDISPQDDDITSTVDYDYLRLGIKKISDTEVFNLQETLCERILELCLENEGVEKATVKTSKIDVYPDCDAVSFQASARKP